MIELVCNNCGFSVRDDKTSQDLMELMEYNQLHCPGCGAFLEVETSNNGKTSKESDLDE